MAKRKHKPGALSYVMRERKRRLAIFEGLEKMTIRAVENIFGIVSKHSAGSKPSPNAERKEKRRRKMAKQSRRINRRLQ